MGYKSPAPPGLFPRDIFTVHINILDELSGEIAVQLLLAQKLLKLSMMCVTPALTEQCAQKNCSAVEER